MSKEKQIVIKEADITNNCPVCYNQKLRLTFYQKHLYNPLYHKTTEKVTHQIQCQKCDSMIYPVNWTPDIERVFDYYNKLISPDKPSIRFTTMFFVLLVAVIALIATGVYFYLQGRS